MLCVRVVMCVLCCDDVVVLVLGVCVVLAGA